jgi:hypothetical protein
VKVSPFETLNIQEAVTCGQQSSDARPHNLSFSSSGARQSYTLC